MTLVRTRGEKNGQPLRCGVPRCGFALGDVRKTAVKTWGQLLEGFRKDDGGGYSLHRHAEQRYRRGLQPRDAHGRWTGGIRGQGPESYNWGPRGESIAGGPDRERLEYRDEVRQGDLVKCPKCGFVNEVTFGLYNVSAE